MNDDTPEKPVKSLKMQQRLCRLVILATPLTLLLVTAGLMPLESLLADLPSHFMMQYALGTGALLVLAAWCRPPKAVCAALGFAFLLSLWQVSPFLPSGKIPPTPGSAKPLKVLEANLLFLNPDAARFKALVEKEKPDIIVVSEVNSVFATALQGLKKDYPHQNIHAEDDNPRGIAVISKAPMESVETAFFDSKHVPSQIFNLRHNGKKITFLSIHPFTPIVNLARRDNEFRLLAEKFSKGSTENLIILGDFNATPWCFGYKKLVAALKLRNARAGRGVFPTWPTSFSLPVMRIPIDHVLLGANMKTHDFRLGPDIGSDHLPVIAEIN